MTAWRHTLQLADIFHNDDLTFIQRRDAIVARIQAAPFYAGAGEHLHEIVDELADTDDTAYFDQVWDTFYDWCDLTLVWIDTI